MIFVSPGAAVGIVADDTANMDRFDQGKHGVHIIITTLTPPPSSSS
jgi:hypothetical protein